MFELRKIRIELQPPIAHLIPDDMIDKDLNEVTEEQLQKLIGQVEEVTDVTIVVVLSEATRLGNVRRMRALGAARKWKMERIFEIMKAEGYEDPNAEDAKEFELTPEDEELYDILVQASAILGSIVIEECENFELPDEIEGWLDVPDWVFDPLLEQSVVLNTHWTTGLVRKNLIVPG